MRDLDRRLALTSKGREDRAIGFAGLSLPKRCRDNVFAEASDCVGLQVRRRSTILRVLIAAHSVNAFVAATRGRALEEVELAAVVVADRDLSFEELVYRRAPTFLEACWDWNWNRPSADDGTRMRWVYSPIFCSSVSASSSEGMARTASSSVSATD